MISTSGASKFHDVCHSDPFDPYLILYIESIFGFYDFSSANLVFYGGISCFLYFLTVPNYLSRHTVKMMCFGIYCVCSITTYPFVIFSYI